MKPLENRGKPKGALVSPYTLACVNHLRIHGPSTLAQLDATIQQVGEWSAIKDGPTRLLRMLHKLREGGHVHRVLREDVILWAHGTNPATACVQAEVRTPAPSASPLVPPPRIDLMRAPPYVPDAGPALRPGALNFKACASVGQRC